MDQSGPLELFVNTEWFALALVALWVIGFLVAPRPRFRARSVSNAARAPDSTS